METAPIKYSDANIAEIGDCIQMDNGQREGVVIDILDSPQRVKECGIKERGLMIKNDYYGLVFLHEKDLAGDEVVLLSRAKS